VLKKGHKQAGDLPNEQTKDHTKRRSLEERANFSPFHLIRGGAGDELKNHLHRARTASKMGENKRVAVQGECRVEK